MSMITIGWLILTKNVNDLKTLTTADVWKDGGRAWQPNLVTCNRLMAFAMGGLFQETTVEHF